MKSVKRLKKVMNMLWLLCLCKVACATNYIPVSSDEQSNSSESFVTTLIRIVASEWVPALEIVASAVLIVLGIQSIIHTINEYKLKREMGVLIEGLGILAILFAAGAAVLYLFSFIQAK